MAESQSKKREMVRLERSTNNFVTHAKVFGLYINRNVRLLKGCKQKSDMTQFYFLKDDLVSELMINQRGVRLKARDRLEVIALIQLRGDTALIYKCSYRVILG